MRVLSRNVLSKAWATLEAVSFDYRRSDGQWQAQRREIYHRGHGAAILLYDLERRTVVLVRQFRFPVWTLGEDGFLLEVPAGIVESQDPEATIRAEAEEETGFVIGEPRFLFRAFASPGSMTEQLYYYAATYDRKLRSGAGGGLRDEGEDIEVLEFTLEQALDMVTSGDIRDAKTIVLLLYARLHVFGSALC